MGDETRKLEMNAALWAINKNMTHEPVASLGAVDRLLRWSKLDHHECDTIRFGVDEVRELVAALTPAAGVVGHMFPDELEALRRGEWPQDVYSEPSETHCQMTGRVKHTVPLFAAPPPADAVRALVGKWRGQAAPGSYSGNALLRCAHELEAALSLPSAADKPVAWVVVDRAMPIASAADNSAFQGCYWSRFETRSAERAERDRDGFASSNPDGRYEVVPLYTRPASARPSAKANHGLVDELSRAEDLLRRVKEDGNAYLLPEIDAFLNRGW